MSIHNVRIEKTICGRNFGAESWDDGGGFAEKPLPEKIDLTSSSIPPHQGFQLKSHDPHIATCPYNQAVIPFGPVSPSNGGAAEVFLAYSTVVQAIVGLLSWKCVRAGMRHPEEDGDLSEYGKQRFADGMREESEKWGVRL